MTTIRFKNKPILNNQSSVLPINQGKIKKSSGLFSVVKKIDHFIDEQSGTVKKILHIARKLIFAAGLYRSKNYCPDAVNGMKFAGEVLDIYAMVHDLYHWYDYFTASYSCRTIDSKQTSESLKQVLKEHGFIINGKDERGVFNDRIEEMIKELVAADTSNYKNEGEAKQKLKGILTENLEINNTILDTEIDLIVNQVQLKQKSYSTPLLMALTCFTVSDLVDCAMTIEKWGVFPFSKYAVQLGTQVPIFRCVVVTVLKIGIDPILNTISCIGIVTIIGIQTYQGAKALIIYFDKEATDKELDEAKKKLWSVSICILSSTVDLACTVAPLCFTFNPLISIVVLPVLSKGTGLICKFIK